MFMILEFFALHNNNCKSCGSFSHNQLLMVRAVAPVINHRYSRWSPLARLNQLTELWNHNTIFAFSFFSLPDSRSLMQIQVVRSPPWTLGPPRPKHVIFIQRKGSANHHTIIVVIYQHKILYIRTFGIEIVLFFLLWMFR